MVLDLPDNLIIFVPLSGQQNDIAALGVFKDIRDGRRRSGWTMTVFPTGC